MGCIPQSRGRRRCRGRRKGTAASPAHPACSHASSTSQRGHRSPAFNTNSLRSGRGVKPCVRPRFAMGSACASPLRPCGVDG
eukprot:126993-Chlamydomonas_euryale.AAC.2